VEKYQNKINELRRLWKIADPKMRKVIETRVKLLKIAESIKTDKFAETVVKELF